MCYCACLCVHVFACGGRAGRVPERFELLFGNDQRRQVGAHLPRR